MSCHASPISPCPTAGSSNTGGGSYRRPAVVSWKSGSGPASIYLCFLWDPARHRHRPRPGTCLRNGYETSLAVIRIQRAAIAVRGPQGRDATRSDTFPQELNDLARCTAAPAKPCCHQARWPLGSYAAGLRAYSGKGLAGLIALLSAGRWRRHDHIGFIHTGGAPALFAYREVLSF